jgi:hypothetical protein
LQSCRNPAFKAFEALAGIIAMAGGEGRRPVAADEQTTDRLVRLAAIVLGLKAAGLLLLAGSALFRPIPGRGLAVALVLGAAMIAVVVGLLQSRRWAWPLALTVLIADALIVGGLLRLLIDVGLALVLFQPPVRARFGLR